MCSSDLIGARADAIFDHGLRLLTDPAAYGAMASAVNPYGDGQAADRILTHIRRHFAGV